MLIPAINLSLHM